MKRIFCLISAFVFVLCLTGCNNNANKTDVSSETSPVQSTATYSRENTNKDAELLFDNLNEIDMLGGSALEYDENDCFEEGRLTYCKVTDKKYTSVKQIKEFMEENLTENLIGGRYVTILGTEEPCFVEKDGNLYVLRAGRGCGFRYTEKPVVTQSNEKGFVAERKYDNFGIESTLRISVVLENEKPKIDSLEVI